MKVLFFVFIFSSTCWSANVAKKEKFEVPKDVANFIEKRDSCDHFRGEEAYDKEREKFIAEKIKESCTGSDKSLADLRRKHRDNPKVIQLLFNYEDKIE